MQNKHRRAGTLTACCRLHYPGRVNRRMGLDLVEYVMAVEDTFEITLDDADLSNIRTVGEFHQLVLKEIGSKPPIIGNTQRAVCASSRAFYSLRKALIRSGVAGRRDITPPTSLESLIPKHRRRAVWDEIAGSMRCRLPRLERPARLCGAIVTGCALFAIAPIAFGFFQSNTDIAVWLGITVVGLPILAFKLSTPAAVEFRRDCQTVKGLVEWLRENQPRRFAAVDRVSTDCEVWQTICRLLVEMQGLEPEQITPDATFVDDLGMD